MTIVASIVEKFAMQIEEPEEGHQEWFLDWVLRSPKNAGRHLTAGWMCLQALRDNLDLRIDWVVEYFGGMGAQAMMIEDLWNPVYHLVQDYSQDAVDHIDKVLGTTAVIADQADAYASEDPPSGVDLVMLDFGDLTVWKTRDGEAHRLLLDRVFAAEPQAVVFTDIACRYLHLHRTRYESLLGEGTCASYETYLEALLARFEELYGYTLVAGYWDRWSAVMALVPSGSAEPGIMRPTPEQPVGLELL